MDSTGAILLDNTLRVPDNNIYCGSGNSTINLSMQVNHASGSSDGADYIVFKYNNSQPYGNGNWAGISQTNSVGGVAYNQASDYRLKKNIRACASVLNGVSKLKVVDYHYKTEADDAERTIGFIAHEVQEQFPELDYVVSGVKDEKCMFCPCCDRFYCTMKDECMKCEKKELDKYQQIDYGKLTPVCIKAIQELTELVSTLQKRIDVLE